MLYVVLKQDLDSLDFVVDSVFKNKEQAEKRNEELIQESLEEYDSQDMSEVVELYESYLTENYLVFNAYNKGYDYDFNYSFELVSLFRNIDEINAFIQGVEYVDNDLSNHIFYITSNELKEMLKEEI